MNQNPTQLPQLPSLPPTTISRVYTGTDVALRFLTLLPDLGVIVVVGILAHDRTIEASSTLLALLAVLAGRLNPATFTKTTPGGH